ncbi:MAG: CNNM domain-containing protein, partial [Bacteroidales bacterium]|nr:CNNM domain-containing protein [Bacteroidales bacterium]
MDPDPLSCCIHLIITAIEAAKPLISISSPSIGALVAVTVATLLLFVSAFISGSEIAYFSITKDDCEQIDDENTRHRVERLLAMPERLLATILISNNLVNVAIVILLNFFMTQFLVIESAVLDFIVQSVILTFLILLFGEIIPKLYASDNSVKFATFASGGLSALSHLLAPLSGLMVRSSTFLNKLVTKHSDEISMEDLSQALEISEVKSGDERELLQGILEFGGKTVAEIMRPRVDVCDIDYNSDFNEVVNIVVTNGYSRMPVFADTPDNIRGILYSKDLLPYMGKSDANFNWQQLLREAYFVPETRMIDDLLEDF